MEAKDGTRWRNMLPKLLWLPSACGGHRSKTSTPGQTLSHLWMGYKLLNLLLVLRLMLVSGGALEAHHRITQLRELPTHSHHVAGQLAKRSGNPTVGGWQDWVCRAGAEQRAKDGEGQTLLTNHNLCLVFRKDMSLWGPDPQISHSTGRDPLLLMSTMFNTHSNQHEQTNTSHVGCWGNNGLQTSCN